MAKFKNPSLSMKEREIALVKLHQAEFEYGSLLKIHHEYDSLLKIHQIEVLKDKIIQNEILTDEDLYTLNNITSFKPLKQLKIQAKELIDIIAIFSILAILIYGFTQFL